MFALQYYTVSKTFFFVLNINTEALLRNNGRSSCLKLIWDPIFMMSWDQLGFHYITKQYYHVNEVKFKVKHLM